MKIVRLNFTTPLHISNARSDYSISESIIHSDTLYSAFIELWNTLDLGKEMLDKIEKFPFSISSLYPYTVDRTSNEIVYFLPKPASFKPVVPIDLNKKVKKIEFIDAQKFKMYQEVGSINFNQNDLKGIYLSGSDIDKDFIKRDTSSRVNISQENSQAQPYYIERIYFKEGSGLYFLLETDSEEAYSLIVRILKYLSFEGIGTDRNVGNGKFNFTIHEFNNLIHLNNILSDYSLNLSLYSPESHELFVSEIDEKTYFNLLTRGGWITTPGFQTLRKKSIRMISEGSVLKKKCGISGCIVNLTPEKTKLPTEMQNIHNVLRIGKSIWVPVKI